MLRLRHGAWSPSAWSDAPPEQPKGSPPHGPPGTTGSPPGRLDGGVFARQGTPCDTGRGAHPRGRTPHLSNRKDRHLMDHLAQPVLLLGAWMAAFLLGKELQQGFAHWR